MSCDQDVQRHDLPFGTYVEEGPGGYRVLFSDGEGHVNDVTHFRTGAGRRYFTVGRVVEPSGRADV